MLFSDPQRLGQKDGRTETFATRVCLNCDARFACGSYQQYAQSGGVREATMVRRYYEDFGGEEEREQRMVATIPDIPTAASLEADI